MACAIDWTALGTWAAVVVALTLSGWDKVERRSRERVEAKLLVMLLLQDLARTMLHVESVQRKIRSDDSPLDGGGIGVAGVMLHLDAMMRSEIGLMAPQIMLPVLESCIDRLHVLPKNVAFVLMQAYVKVNYSRGGLESLRKATGRELVREKFDEFIFALRETLQETRDALKCAEIACVKLAKA